MNASDWIECAEMTQPEFFRITDAAFGESRVPQVARPKVQLRETVCGGCGTRLTSMSGAMSCEIERGTTWPDAIGSTSRPLTLFSQRVLDGLHRIGATGFTSEPVNITRVQSERLRRLPAPDYYYFKVNGAIDVDLNASGMGGVERCPVCFGSLADTNPEVRRLVPIRNSWDGSDLFKMRNFPNSLVFGTRRVLELARGERWTNFRFEPMDVVRKHASGWDGIDYLGSAWPPERWYPPSPSAGRPLREWLSEMRAADREVARAARVAVQDIGEEDPASVIPYLAAMLDDVDGSLQRDAARLLFNINSRCPLPSNLKRQVQSLLPPELASRWVQD